MLAIASLFDQPASTHLSEAVTIGVEYICLVRAYVLCTVVWGVWWIPEKIAWRGNGLTSQEPAFSQPAWGEMFASNHDRLVLKTQDRTSDKFHKSEFDRYIFHRLESEWCIRHQDIGFCPPTSIYVVIEVSSKPSCALMTGDWSHLVQVKIGTYMSKKDHDDITAPIQTPVWSRGRT